MSNPKLDLDLVSDSASEQGFGSKEVSDSESFTSETMSALPDEEEEPQSPSSVAAKPAETGKVSPATLPEVKDRIEQTVRQLSSGTCAAGSRTGLLDTLVKDVSMVYSYAPELARYFLQLFPVPEAIEFFEANEKARPLTIRVNTLKTKRRLLAQTLISTRSMSIDPIPFSKDVGLTVTASAVPVGATPEYLTGRYMIQSAASMIPVLALDAQPGERVLDMAAAPGGKTTHIAQCMENKGVLFANDMKKDRITSLIANIQRLGVKNAIVSCLDGRKLDGVLPKNSLDRVLLDAPCSGSGIIARDPSVKAKRGEQDFKENAILQKELLATAVDLVKPGGFIVYSTCSVAVEENEAVIDHILKKRHVKLVEFAVGVEGVDAFTNFKAKAFHPDLKKAKRFYPHVHNLDGFFVAKLVKLENSKKGAVSRKDRSTVEEVVWGDKELADMAHLMEDVVEFPEDVQPAKMAPPAGAKRQHGKPQASGAGPKRKFDRKPQTGSKKPRTQ